MELIVVPRFKVSPNSDKTNVNEYTAWECVLTVSTSIAMQDVAHYVFFGQSPIVAFHKAVIGLDVLLRSPEFVYPTVKGVFEDVKEA
jgi:hypothetical protein